ncbi:MAG TPA: YceI family protein [Chitinophagaceae bacterium]|nr:YceI family protein [Chitinophagaceae bacterium]
MKFGVSESYYRCTPVFRRRFGRDLQDVAFRMLKSVVLWLFLATPAVKAQNNRYFVTSSKVVFVSNAPLETIKAVSQELKGVIDVSTRSIAFSIANTTFEGFNSALQQDHFHENYVESERYPHCTFSGKIIDEVDFTRDGTYAIRVKGFLNVKGISQEKIIKGTITVKGEELLISCTFSVAVADHQIRIPRIVQQKIAPVIEISVTAKLVKEGVK